jgi:sugar phosphate isomerase/epimerase
MKPPSYPESREIPLITDADIERRVNQLIGRANVRQLWLLFLDEEFLQLPEIMPIVGMPSDPSDTAASVVVGEIVEAMNKIGASSVVMVWERYASASLTPQDAAWARALHETCADHGIRLRAMLLSHRTGVRWMAADDYLFLGSASGGRHLQGS